MKKKIYIILIVIILLLVTGCASKKENTATSTDKGSFDTGGITHDDNKGLINSGSETKSTEVEIISESKTEGITASTVERDTVSITEGEEGYEMTSKDAEFILPKIDAYAGLLTAGEWNDNQNWGFLVNLVSGGHLDFPAFRMNPLKRVVVNVTSETGPVKNADAVLYNEAGEIVWEAVTDYMGIAYTFYQVVDSNSIPASVTVTKNGISASEVVVLQEQMEGEQGGASFVSSSEVIITLVDEATTKALDIMFVFDTTGSMSDELLYLQKEFEDIAKKVSDQSTRFSVNFYRDKGDEYVVKSNKFTADSNEVMKQLNAEYSGGGGDYPEAVDEALFDGVFQHSWNKDSVKLLFLILDAPPHSGDAQVDDTLQRSIREAAKQGIRIIPIASSGVDKETETFLRTASILTGGTYTFLTDHSGIGGTHLEPTIGSYDVEYLNDCIVRLIQLYYQ